LALFLGAAAVLLVLAGIASNVEDIEFTATEREPRAVPLGDNGEREDFAPLARGESSPPEQREPQEVGWVAVVIGVVLGAGALWFLSKQRIKVMLRRRSFQSTVPTSELSDEEHAEAIVEFADTLIDDLRQGGDPGEAIQRCYAAVETGFGKRELRRKPAETPNKYLDRVFGRNAAAAEPLHTLTDLFQVARFSQEPVTEAMRDTAIDSLVEIRTNYAQLGRKRTRVS
jgi:hypothetical protein